ncbi:hypothetical protein ATANTOWER_031726 [Ataeniobius toweri]|uniref:PIH1 N-terminal domain-containing protein n=1 Tax=Ataeniobius toweri TaxID=208326 RepID=A0ABU7BCL1_9TELE|nr:hypothetical protein [Ataeniobius toweri]
MDIGEKLKELNLSSEEVGRFTKAFKDDKFREMFCEYVQEISEPENRRKYEEEIRQLEQERGNKVEFIQPTPFRVIKTSAAGKQKCFINICANDTIQKPEGKSALSEDGRRGQCWTLPHSLHPGRLNKTLHFSTFHPWRNPRFLLRFLSHQPRPLKARAVWGMSGFQGGRWSPARCLLQMQQERGGKQVKMTCQNITSPRGQSRTTSHQSKCH